MGPPMSWWIVKSWFNCGLKALKVGFSEVFERINQLKSFDVPHSNINTLILNRFHKDLFPGKTWK